MKRIITLITAAALLITGILALTGCGEGSGSAGDVSAESSAEGSGGTGKVKVVDIPLTEEEYAFGVDKNQPELLEEVNKFIAQIQSDGTFDKICEKYFGGGTPEAVVSAKPDAGKDQLVVATNAGFEPFEYTGGEQDQYYGVDMEIAALLAKQLGKELVISNMDFEAVCLSVGQGKADIAMAGLTIKEDRKEYVNFSDKYYDAAQKIITMTSDKTFDGCKEAADVEKILKGLPAETKIGVQTGTTGQFYVEGDKDWGFEGYNVKCVGYKSGSLAVQDMINGNIDYVIIDEAPANSIVNAINELN